MTTIQADRPAPASRLSAAGHLGRPRADTLQRLWETPMRNIPAEGMRRKSAAAIVLTLAFVFAMSGCGGGSDPEPQPPAGGAPIGPPVSQSIGPEGGRVEVAAAGTSASVEVPAGVLAATTTITLTPLAPAAGQLMALRIEPAGTILEGDLRITMKPARAPGERALATLRTDGDRVLVPTAVDRAGGIATATLRWIGATDAAAARAQALRTRPQAASDRVGELILNEQLDAAERILAADLAQTRMVNQQNYEAAIGYQMTIIALVQSRDLDGFSAVGPWLERAKTSACASLANAVQTAASTGATTYGRFKALAGRMFYWQAIAQALGGDACPAEAEVQPTLQSKFSEFVAFMRGLFDARPTGEELRRPVAEVAEAKVLSQQARSLALPAQATRIEQQVLDPVLLPLREAVYKPCRESNDPSALFQALQTYARNEALLGDLHLCHARISAQTRSEADLALETQSLGGGVTVAEHVREVGIAYDPRGRLRLSGELRALKCPNGLADTETVTLRIGATVVHRLPPLGEAYLGQAVTLEVRALLDAAGITEATVHDLALWREGTACGGVLGESNVKLATLALGGGPKLGTFDLTGGNVRALASDAKGNLYVQGTNAAAFGLTGPAGAFVAKLTPALKAVWIVPFSVNNRGVAGIGVDAAGNVRLGGSQASGLWVARLDGRTGALAWDLSFGATDRTIAAGLAVDAAGNVVIAGGTFGSIAGSTSIGRGDGFIVRVDPEGRLLWARNVGGNDEEGAIDVALDAAGDAYLLVNETTGIKRIGTWEHLDRGLAVYKFSPEGTQLWRSPYDTIYWDAGRGIAVTGGGVVLTMGIRYEIEDDTGFSLRSVPVLRQLGSAAGGGTASEMNIGMGAMARGPAGDVCSVGRNARYSAPDFVPPFESFLICFDSNGNLKWSKTIASSEATVITVDGLGIVTIAGLMGENEAAFYARYRLRDGAQQ